MTIKLKALNSISEDLLNNQQLLRETILKALYAADEMLSPDIGLLTAATIEGFDSGNHVVRISLTVDDMQIERLTCDACPKCRVAEKI